LPLGVEGFFPPLTSCNIHRPLLTALELSMLRLALLVTGLKILDLGSGSGRDCYVAAALVGEKGSVTGIDMTAEQLQVARDHAESFCTKTLG
jgi:ubiquinone/menaquinone biosynthesis C-methylase UbiE